MNVVLLARSYAGPGIGSLVSSQLLSDAFTAIATGTGTLAAIGTTYILPAVGFGAAGVKVGFIAAAVQASV